ncbi:hypothetical protein [Roseinatronobacter sp.]|uniref:hypothetical protein n=1 Tax=Roseinatronobacter sp. TaxID=1945755 RepID=UPI0025F28E98|nr:hypothetical protein [Roseibaca sp.]
MTDQELMAIEKERVQNMLQTAMAEIDETGGSVRFFAAAFLVQAFALHVEIEGTDNLQAAMARLGREELTRRGKAGRA